MSFTASKVMEADARPPLQWSAQFTALISPATSTLLGDKISLPPSALEKLLAASANAIQLPTPDQSSSFNGFNQYSRVAQRQVESQFIDQKNQLPHPLTFRLVNPDNGRVIYAGIREFSAEEGQTVLSPFLWQALGLKERDTSPGKSEDVDMADGIATKEDVIVSGPSITIHAKELPKGTYVKLRPLEAGYDPDDWKALLERHMRLNYTTLTNGEVLIVPGGRGIGGKNEEFRFLVDGFKPDSDAICVVDTDLEVDIEALNEEQARETLNRIAAKIRKTPGTDQGSSVGGDLDIFKAQQGQVLPGDYINYQLPSWPRAQPLEIELDGLDDEDDVDLLINPYSAHQRSRPRLDEHVFADFGGRPAKRIRLEPTNVELEDAEALWISVHAFTPNNEHGSSAAPTDAPAAHLRHFTLRVRPADSRASSNGTRAEDDAIPNPGDVRCKNCHQWVPERTLMLHENFCLRNNLLCPHGCGQVFQKRSEAHANHWHCPHDTFYGNTSLSHQKHDTLYHPSSPLSCSNCETAQTFSSILLLAAHRTSTCPAKEILCRFCHLEVPQEGDPDVPNAEALLSGLTAHELADGARTTECHLCSRIVRLRDMDIHLKHHNLERKTRPMPRMCRNVNCGRTLDGANHGGDTRAGTKMGQGPGNDMSLCSTCYGPMYVSLYDPEGKALKRRIERRYLQQLLTGCGKKWCRNKFCKNGRQNLDITPNAVSTKEALPIIKPFLSDAINADSNTPLQFCVDEQSQKRRALASMLAAEGTEHAETARLVQGNGYALPWCVAALEAEGGDLDRARSWLGNWAPTRAEEKGV